MRVFSYSAQSLARVAAVTAGVTPLTSPPISFREFQPTWLEDFDLIFFKLHGRPEQPFWYGDGHITAISAEQLRDARLDGALVFAPNCHGGRDSAMTRAMVAAGARSVVVGERLNTLLVTNVIEFVWRKSLQAGTTADQALRLGKLTARLRYPRLGADVDSFYLIGQPDARLERNAPHGSSTES